MKTRTNPNAPTRRHNGRPIHDTGWIVEERPNIQPSNINGLKRISQYGPGIRRGHD